MRRSWLWRFLTSREGVLTVLVTATGTLALGLMPNIADSLPYVGDSAWGLAGLALVSVVACAFAAQSLRSKPGVGIIFYLGATPQWDRLRIELMERDARRRHETAFVIDPHTLLGGLTVSDRVTFAFRVMQARMAETAVLSGEMPQSVSFYLVARHPDAYHLGSLLRAQLHEDVTVMDEREHVREALVQGQLVAQSEERGRSTFPILRLDSTLKREPDDGVRARLRGVVPDGEGAEWHWLARPPEGARPRRLALIVSMSDNVGMVPDALHAAGHGESAVYAFDDRLAPEDLRCAGALVIRTTRGNLPDRTEVHEAFLRHLVHHWRRALETHQPTGECLLFIDGPAPVVLALGALFGRRLSLVPLRGRHAASPPATPQPTPPATDPNPPTTPGSSS